MFNYLTRWLSYSLDNIALEYKYLRLISYILAFPPPFLWLAYSLSSLKKSLQQKIYSSCHYSPYFYLLLSERALFSSAQWTANWWPVPFTQQQGHFEWMAHLRLWILAGGGSLLTAGKKWILNPEIRALQMRVLAPSRCSVIIRKTFFALISTYTKPPVAFG